MIKLTELSQKLWLKAELATSPLMQERVMPHLHEARGLAQQYLRPYMTIDQWRGSGLGGPLIVNYVGAKQVTPLLKSMLFTTKPVEESLDKTPIWRSSELANLPTGDITIIEANKHLIHQLPHEQTFVMPSFVEMGLDVRGTWDEVSSRFRKSSVRSELRLTRKYGYEYEISHDEQDFEHFYHRMYLPNVDTRHGERGVPMPYPEAYEYFLRGLLFFVTRDDKRVCASLFYLDQDIANFILVGVLDGDQQLMKEGVVGALNVLRLKWANENGYKGVNFGWYRPFMTTLLRNKRKWGASVSIPPNLSKHIWVKIQRNTPAVAQFMEDTFCIVLAPQNQLYGLMTVDDPESAKENNEDDLRHQYETAGLKGLLLCSMNDFMENEALTAKIEAKNRILF